MEHERITKSIQKEQATKTPSASALQTKLAERSSMHPVVQLQRAVGNQAVQRMMNAGQSGLQTQQDSPNVNPALTIPSRMHNVLRSPGQPLAPTTRAFMEPRFGQDFSDVRIHTDEQAAESAHQVNARAYTVDKDVVFGADQFAPETREGRRLIAHELTHVVQQQGNKTSIAMKKLLIGAPGDAYERQAAAVANRVTEGDAVAPQTISTTPAPTLQRASLSDMWEGTKNVASSVGGTIASVGEKAWEGAKSVGSAVGGTVVSAGQFVGGVVSTGVKFATGEISLAELLGIPEPSGIGPAVLAIIIRVLQNPVVQALPGFILPPFVLEGLKKALISIQAIWNLIQNPGVILDMIKGYFQQKIDTVPVKIQEALIPVSSVLGDKARMHLKGIWRHLEPKLEELKNKWWPMLKEMGKDLINPFPKVWQEMQKSWGQIKNLATHIWHGKFSQAVDDYLAIWQSIIGIVGLLSFLISLGIVIGFAIAGGVAGAAAGGAGAIPGAFAGAGAGFALAAEVGEAILIATVAVETAIILKSVYNLASIDQTAEEQDEDYERIANSSLTLGITGALMLLGALAARLAKAIIQSAKAAIRGALRAVAGEAESAAAPAGARAVPPAEPAPPKAVSETETPKVEPAPEVEPKSEPETPEPETPKPEPETPEPETPKVEPETPEPETPKSEPEPEPSPREKILEKVKEDLKELQMKKAQNQAMIEKLEEQLHAAENKVKQLSEKVNSLPRGSKARAEAMEEFKAAKQALEDLKEADELGGYREERSKLTKAEEDLSKSLERKLKFERPKLWDSTKDAIIKAAEERGQKTPDGRFLDANTGKVIEDKPVFGHKHGFEHRRLVLKAASKGMTQEQFAKWVNDHPEWFQIESDASNSSHKYEKPGTDGWENIGD